MSILIKGMEMPPNCMLCSFCVTEADEANGEMCMVTGKLMPPCNHERLDDCPLVPISPHGDLIDRDALMQHEVLLLRDGGRLPIIYASYVRNAPTVIPAEEGEW